MAITILVGKEAPAKSNEFPKPRPKSVITITVSPGTPTKMPTAPAGITITVGPGEPKIEPEIPSEVDLEPAKEPKKYKLNARKSLAGDIMVFDHPDIDVIISGPKVVTLAKSKQSDLAYLSQQRCFDYLYKRGVIDFHSVKGGAVYGSMEASISGFDQFSDAGALALLNVAKWINEEEAEYIQTVKDLKSGENERLLEPDEENSTELGEVPHADKKGGNPSGDKQNQMNLYRAQWIM